MTTCQYCDGTGACGTCQSHGCGDCMYTGCCDACAGGNRDAARAKAERTGRCHFVVRSGGGYRVIDADDYAPRWNGSRTTPTIVWAAWASYWRYGEGR